MAGVTPDVNLRIKKPTKYMIEGSNLAFKPGENVTWSPKSGAPQNELMHSKLKLKVFTIRDTYWSIIDNTSCFNYIPLGNNHTHFSSFRWTQLWEQITLCNNTWSLATNHKPVLPSLSHVARKVGLSVFGSNPSGVRIQVESSLVSLKPIHLS